MKLGVLFESAVDVQTAARLADEGALVIDVREAAEWAAGHAPGSRNIPLGGLARQVRTLPGDRTILVVCHSGQRSRTAVGLLRQNGLDAVNVSGGMRAWVPAGLPWTR